MKWHTGCLLIVVAVIAGYVYHMKSKHSGQSIL